jgi:hypothetical protein
MSNRLKLHEELVSLAGPSYQVYFQPPSNVEIHHPCIVYSRSSGLSTFADNRPYMHTERYQINVITKDPDDGLCNKLLEHFPMSRDERHYSSNNLHHNIISLYY